MAQSRITKNRSAASRRRSVAVSCTLLVIASLFAVEVAADVQQQRQLRGKRAVDITKRRRTKAESVRKSHSSEAEAETTTGLEKMNRIVGGAPVESASAFPWFTRVVGGTPENGGGEACGGALIAKDLVLTAAHCGDPRKAYPGRYDLNNLASESLDAESFVRHPDYDLSLSSINYDIMIVKLSEPSVAKPVRLNYNDEYPVEADEELTMLGFGSTIGGPATGLPNPPNQQAKVLQTATTLYVPFETCAVASDPELGSKYGISTTNTFVKDHWFCTTGPEIDSNLVTSTCYGDSGGPILKEDYFEGIVEEGDTGDLLLAVISGTSGFCGNKNLPLLNSRVSAHKQWIVENGCALSDDPPPEWQCDIEGVTGLGMAPDDNSVYFVVVPETEAVTAAPTDSPTVKVTAAPTDSPTVKVTAAPTDSPTVKVTAAPSDSPTVKVTAAPTVSPSVSPTGTSPTVAPSASPTGSPTTASPTVSPTTGLPSASPTTASPSAFPTLVPTTEKPNPFLNPVLNPESADKEKDRKDKDKEEEEVEEEAEDIYVCPICEEVDEVIVNGEAVVFVPIMGQMTCQALFDDAAKGKIGKGSTCESVLLMSRSVCTCASATDSPTEMPSDSPSVSPSDSPSSSPSATPSYSPTTSPSDSPSVSPSSSPSLGPTKTPGTCEAIRIANEARDPAMMVNVDISFLFDDLEAAESVGWYLSDPDYECFRVGMPAGRYAKMESIETLSLVEGVEYLFVLEVDGKQAAGTYEISSGNATLAHNLIPGVIYDDEGTLFKTPRN